MFKNLFEIKKIKKENEKLKSDNANYLKIISEYARKSFNDIKSSVDIKDFCTNEYKTKFESFVNNESHSEIEILNKFNELYNKERLYFNGIATCIDFIRTKRNPKISTEKQILKFILTETGRHALDSITESIYNTGANNE